MCSLKCVIRGDGVSCDKEAEYICYGMSLCREHLKERVEADEKRSLAQLEEARERFRRTLESYQ